MTFQALATVTLQIWHRSKGHSRPGRFRNGGHVNALPPKGSSQSERIVTISTNNRTIFAALATNAPPDQHAIDPRTGRSRLTVIGDTKGALREWVGVGVCQGESESAKSEEGPP